MVVNLPEALGGWLVTGIAIKFSLFEKQSNFIDDKHNNL